MPAAPIPRRTAAQNAAIWSSVATLAARSGLSREEVEEAVLVPLCERVSSQQHTSALDVNQAKKVIVALQAELAKYDLKLTPSAAPRPRPTLTPIAGGAADTPVDAEQGVEVRPRPATFLRPVRVTERPRPHEPWAPRHPGTRDQPATAFQAQLIATLFELLDMQGPSRAAFVQRQLKGRTRVETQADADAIVEPCKRMLLARRCLQVLLQTTETALATPDDLWIVTGARDLAWKRAALVDFRDRFAAAWAKKMDTPLRDVPLTMGALHKWLECIYAARCGGGR